MEGMREGRLACRWDGGQGRPLEQTLNFAI